MIAFFSVVKPLVRIADQHSGRIQATAFMPVFSTYEQAEAAQGSSGAPIYEVARIESCDDFEPYTPNGDGPQLI